MTARLRFNQYLNRPLPFKDLLSEFVYYRTYSRYLPHIKRRETWFETVSRAVTFLQVHTPEIPLDSLLWDDIFTAIYDHEVMPSMRLMWSAGPAAEASNVALYNCAFHAITSLRSFSETLYILMCGTGVGVSVSQAHVSKLPLVHPRMYDTVSRTYHVEDSREGWAEALHFGLKQWFNGADVRFDYSKLRPEGTPLKTMGGRSSSPLALKSLLDFTKRIVLLRQGQRLRPIDVSDIINKIGEVVVVGGVRRSSEIVLFDPTDEEMLHAKDAPYWEHSPHRSMSNNSILFTEKPDPIAFKHLWETISSSTTGEPGVFIQTNATVTAPRRAPHPDFGTNPCATGDTLISTLKGPRTFEQLAQDGKDVLVHCLDLTTGRPQVRVMRRPHKTRTATPVLKVTFDSGLVLRLTPDHQLITFRRNKIKAEDLTPGQSIRAFSLYEGRRKQDQYRSVTGWDRDANKSQEVLEHHMVCENYYGPVPPGYVVHHKNGVKNDNDIDNLELLTASDHQSEHYAQRVQGGF